MASIDSTANVQPLTPDQISDAEYYGVEIAVLESGDFAVFTHDWRRAVAAVRREYGPARRVTFGKPEWWLVVDNCGCGDECRCEVDEDGDVVDPECDLPGLPPCEEEFVWRGVRCAEGAPGALLRACPGGGVMTTPMLEGHESFVLPDWDASAQGLFDREYVLAYLPPALIANPLTRLLSTGWWELLTVADYWAGNPASDEWSLWASRNTPTEHLAAWVQQRVGFPVTLQPDTTEVTRLGQQARTYTVPLYWVTCPATPGEGAA